MKRPTMLVEAILRQAEMDLDLSVERDVATMRRRCKHEGLSFLTITLPLLSDSLERGLEAGRFSCPTNFSSHGSLPRFLGGFFKRVFTLDGTLRTDSCPDAVFFIRQVCRFFKKLKLECSDSRNREAIQHFVDVEGDLRAMTSQVERKDEILDKISGIIWSQVFPEIDPINLICHHGPGATAEHYALNERQQIRYWNQRSEHTFPSDLHCYPNFGLAAQASGIWESSSEPQSLNYLELKEEIPVRVVFVPKTQTSPRVIAIEPSHVQFKQQSVKDYVYWMLESHALTKHSIRFARQDVNQKLAYSSSIDRRLATLDLKDASDRVHLHLVQRIFKTSGLLPFLEDARSLHATLPDGRNMVLFKYASMGSALCFPVEAMVFYTLIQSAMHQLDGIRPSSSSIKKFSSMIDVYGDDIIVPVDYADVVVRYLESYALKVNVNKSFRFSHFRESCGADYYKGIPVNPVYAREYPHDNSQHWEPNTVMSWVATADLFYIRGMWVVAQEIRDMVCRVVRRTIPKTRELGSGLAFFSFLFSTHLRYDSNLHTWRQKRLHYDPIKRKDSIDGNELACLNKWGFSTVEPTRRRLDFDLDARACLVNRLRWRRDGFRADYGESQSEDPHVDATVSERGVCDLQTGLSSYGNSHSGLQCLVEECISPSDGGTRPSEGDITCYSDWSDERDLDPLHFLTGKTEGLTFTHSTNRGRFKSKCRWVSLAG